MNYKQLTAGIIALLAFLYLAQPVLAQETITSSEEDTVYQMDEIIISASKYPESPQTAGRNVSVISREDIRQSIHTSVSELLGEQQGFHIIGSGQTAGSLQQGFLRNANSNHSLVMIDGVRISDPSTVNNSIDLSELSLTGIERIEIVRGSHSALYGSSAIGGVVNIITRKSADTGINADVSTKHGNFGAGTYSTQNSLFANVTGAGGFYTNIGVDQQYTRGLDATVDTSGGAAVFNPQDRDNFRKLDLKGKVGYHNSDYDLYASYNRKDQKVDADQGAYQDDSNAYTQFNRDLLGYGAGYNISETFSLNFDGAYSTLDRDFVNDSSLVDTNENYDGEYNETNGEGTLWENELRAVTESEFLRLVTGISASRQTMNTRSYTYVRDFNFESTTDLDSLNLEEVIYSGYVNVNVSGGLLTAELESFSLGLGGRYSHHNQFGSHATYEINPKYHFSSHGTLYGAVTTGFNAPSLYKLHNPVQGFGAYTTRGNENLGPEKSISYEIGWRQSVGQSLSFNLSLFNTKVSDAIEYVYLWNSSTNQDQLTGMDYLGDTYINVSKQDINGIEATINLQLLTNLSFKGNLSLTKSTLRFEPADIDEDYTGGNHVQIYESGEFISEEKELEGLTRRPQTNAFLQLEYQPVSRLNLKANTRFVGSREDIFYSQNLGPFGALDYSKVDGYNLTDFSARYQFTDKIALIGKVENILNTDYVEINGYNTRGRGFYLKAQLSL